MATAVNFNAVGDTAITVLLPVGFSKYRLSSIIIKNASGDISSAHFALYSAPAAGGTAIRADTQCTVTTGAINTAGNLQAVGMSVDSEYNLVTLYFRLTVAQGAARTADVIINAVPTA